MLIRSFFDTCQDRVLVAHDNLSGGRSRFFAVCICAILRKSRVWIDCSRHALTFLMQCYQLLICHLIDLVHLSLSVCRNELLDNHETSTDTDDQLAIQNLCIDFLRTKQIETISNFPNWNWAVGLIDVMAEHLIKQVTLWKGKNWSLLLISDLPVHYLNDLVFILQESLHLLNLINLLRNTLRKVIKSLQQDFLILRESLDVSIQPLNVSVQVSDL